MSANEIKTSEKSKENQNSFDANYTQKWGEPFKPTTQNENGHTRSDTNNDISASAPPLVGLSLYNSLLVRCTDNVPKPKIAWGQKYVDEKGRDIVIPLGEIGDFSVITGRAKSRKSFGVAIATATALKGYCLIGNLVSNIDKDKKIILFDTEQKNYHLWKAAKRIGKIAGYENEHPENLEVCGLRGLSPSECWSIICAVIESRDDIGLVMIDGLVDIVEDGGILDRKEAVQVITQIMKWTQNKNMHIATVLHLNPNSDKMRGHIGTEALNKAGIVINVEDNGDGTSTVSTKVARDRQFEPFAFSIDADGIPIEATPPKKLQQTEKINLAVLEEDGMKALIRIVYSNGGEFSRKILIEQLQIAGKEYYGVEPGQTNTGKFITRAKNMGLLVQSKEKGPYELSDGLKMEFYPPEVEPEPRQTEIFE